MYIRYTIQDKHRFCNLTKYRDNAPMVNLDLHLPMNAVPDASQVSSIPALSEVELGTNLCDKVVELLATGKCFPATAATNKTDHNNIT
jgi:hypothetical protein